MTNIKQSIIPELVSGSSTQVVAVHNKDRYSRGFLSGIFHAYPPSPRCIRTRPSPSRERGQERVLTLNPSGTRKNKLSPSPVGEKVREAEMREKGFTLIELLVVVLIIAILAAVALPQYQKAVINSRYHRLMPLVNHIYQAQQTYYLSNGTYTQDFNELTLDIGGKEVIEGKSPKYWTRYFDWGSCRFNSFPSYAFCRDERADISYLVYLASGIKNCVYYNNNALAQQICQQETNNSLVPGKSNWYRYP